ncbi:MAG: hypothetical protein Kow00109_11150 [Acidobacteriota bacterium]
MESEVGIGLSLFLLVVLLYFSLIEAAAQNLSRLALKVLAEKHSARPYALLNSLATERRSFLLPLQLVSVVLLVLASVLLSTALAAELGHSLGVAVAVSALLAVTVRLLLPQFIVQGRAEAMLLWMLPSLRFLYPVIAVVGKPVLGFLRLTARRRENGRPPEAEDEVSDEEIQAYLGVGEEEGLFEREESELIQSALEFGSTLVREIMTPRNEIVAIEESATLAELRELIVSSKHSRIPVYREQLDHIVGVVYVRSLLAHLEPGREQDPITPIITEVLIVPETKKVYDLLKEMQSQGEQLAIVVNEYGTVSGLVTLEDLVEEIVGEIRDEDELPSEDVVYEGGGSWVVRGGAEVEQLEMALGVDFGEHDAATVSGLVVEHLGRVPRTGETVRLDGLLLHILSADGKRIHTLRVHAEKRPALDTSVESPATEKLG